MSALVQPNPQQIAAVFGVIEPPPIHVECETFQGPLTTLFIMVRDHKVDLLGVPLGPICEAYLRYLLETTEPHLESHAVAVSALCYLLEKKAWMLIPIEQDEEPDDDGLFDEVEPYIHEFLPAIDDLLHRREDREHLFFRTGENSNVYELPFETSEVTSADLAKAFEKLLSKAKPDPPRPVSDQRRSLSEQIILVLKSLPDTPQALEEFVTGEFTRSEVVWWFLALLEIIRLGQASVTMDDGIVKFCKKQSRSAPA